MDSVRCLCRSSVSHKVDFGGRSGPKRTRNRGQVLVTMRIWGGRANPSRGYSCSNYSCSNNEGNDGRWTIQFLHWITYMSYIPVPMRYSSLLAGCALVSCSFVARTCDGQTAKAITATSKSLFTKLLPSLIASRAVIVCFVCLSVVMMLQC
jgi:hypothetical protein